MGSASELHFGWLTEASSLVLIPLAFGASLVLLWLLIGLAMRRSTAPEVHAETIYKQENRSSQQQNLHKLRLKLEQQDQHPIIFGKSKESILVAHNEHHQSQADDASLCGRHLRLLTDDHGHSIEIRMSSPPPRNCEQVSTISQSATQLGAHQSECSSQLHHKTRRTRPSSSSSSRKSSRQQRADGAHVEPKAILDYSSPVDADEANNSDIMQLDGCHPLGHKDVWDSRQDTSMDADSSPRSIDSNDCVIDSDCQHRRSSRQSVELVIAAKTSAALDRSRLERIHLDEPSSGQLPSGSSFPATNNQDSGYQSRRASSSQESIFALSMATTRLAWSGHLGPPRLRMSASLLMMQSEQRSSASHRRWLFGKTPARTRQPLSSMSSCEAALQAKALGHGNSNSNSSKFRIRLELLEASNVVGKPSGRSSQPADTGDQSRRRNSAETFSVRAFKTLASSVSTQDSAGSSSVDWFVQLASVSRWPPDCSLKFAAPPPRGHSAQPSRSQPQLQSHDVASSAAAGSFSLELEAHEFPVRLSLYQLSRRGNSRRTVGHCVVQLGDFIDELKLTASGHDHSPAHNNSNSQDHRGHQHDHNLRSQMAEQLQPEAKFVILHQEAGHGQLQLEYLLHESILEAVK